MQHQKNLYISKEFDEHYVLNYMFVILNTAAMGAVN